MKLRVVTPARPIVDAETAEVTAPGEVGEFGVLPEHVTFLGGLDVGILSYVEKGQQRQVVVCGGYAEVCDDVLTVLADEAEFPEEIDAAEASAELARVEQALETGSEDPAEVDSLLRQLKKAQTRVAAAS